jgi:hypothetical protein
MLIGSDDVTTARTYGSSGLASDAALHAAAAWKREAWSLAIALAHEGHFSWEDLRQALLIERGTEAHALDWSALQRWLNALKRVVHEAGLVDVGALAELGRWAERAAARE